MEKSKLERIIRLIREEMMTVGNTGYTSKGNQTRAGFDPVQGGMERRKAPKFMVLPPGMRKRWSLKKKKSES